MTLPWLAKGLDQAFIELCLRPTLTVVTQTSPLARLRIAEQRTQISLRDDEVFPATVTPQFTITQTRRLRENRKELTLTWPAPTVPIEKVWFPEYDRYRTTKSQWRVHALPRPLVVLVAGWVPLRWLWPIERLSHAGFDVALARLPRSARLFPKNRDDSLPSRDPSRNIIELARAASELGQLLTVAKERGHPSTLVWGTSLGAHIVALLATLPHAVHAAKYVLEKPVSRMSDALRLHGRGDSTLRSEVAARLDNVYRAVSPLERNPQVDAGSILVIGGQFDRMTPLATAQLLASHFNVPLRPIKASHLLDPGRSRRLTKVVVECLHR